MVKGLIYLIVVQTHDKKEFIEKFYKLAEEYNCAIEYHPLHGMCVVQLKK